MTQVGLQFHAAPDELFELARQWAAKWQLTAVSVDLFPAFQAQVVGASEPRPMRDRTNFVALCRLAPEMAAGTWAEFVESNAETLYVHVQPVNPEGLRESSIGGVSVDPVSLKLWRSIVRAAKAWMHTGAIVRNPASGAERPLPHHRHTPGAHNLADSGIVMLAVGGWVEYAFTDLASITSLT